MSQPRIDKLHALLERVRERRAEPRLVAVAGVRPLESANTNLEQREPPRIVESARSLEPARSEPPRLEPPAPRRTSSVQPAVLLESEPPVAAGELSLEARTSTVPPASESAARAANEPSQRIAPSAALPFDSAVKQASPARVESAKTFGELLELSLSLRPR